MTTIEVKKGMIAIHIADCVVTLCVAPLLSPSADLDSLSENELQTAVHYAARNDAVHALQALVDLNGMLMPTLKGAGLERVMYTPCGKT